jgi:hypothetical protein
MISGQADEFVTVNEENPVITSCNRRRTQSPRQGGRRYAVGHERWHVDIPHHDPALGLSSRQYRRDAALGGLDLNCGAEQTTAAPFPALPRLSVQVTTVWSIHFRFDSVRLCWRTVTKPAHIATRPDQREKQSVRVLIVEDERIVAMNLEKCLRNLRYEIAGGAVSGEAAIELAA